MTHDRTVAAETLRGLVDVLTEALGPRAVSIDLAKRERFSVDEATMSPILSARMPLGLADVVVTPGSVDDVPLIVREAVRRGVPITPRGRGTGNYGQAIPAQGGIVLDLTKLTAVDDIGDGVITAEAGARMVSLETLAHASGQELWMYPSTAQSTIGGFLAGGSAGTGTIANGNNRKGFVVALDVVHAVDDAEIVHLEGEDAQLYVHSYGVAGIIVRATVRLEPLRHWRSVYASFARFDDALGSLRPLRELDPTPRLISCDEAAMLATLPADPALSLDRASVRLLVDPAALGAAETVIAAHGGCVDEVREGPQAMLKLSMISYNHPSWWLISRNPGRYFHLEVFGEPLVTAPDPIRAVYPGGMLHVEVGHAFIFGMLNAPFESEEQVVEGIARLEALGLSVHSPHSWSVDQRVDELVELASVTDPHGLLNPGKLVASA